MNRLPNHYKKDHLTRQQRVAVIANVVSAILLALYPSYSSPRGPALALLITTPVIACYIGSIYLYSKSIGNTIFLWVGVSIAALLIKVADGTFADFFWRFFIDTTIYFLIGCFFLKRGLSFIQLFLILFAPSILLFALFTNPSSEIQKGAYPLLLANYIALGLVFLYSRLQNKTEIIVASIVVTGLLAFIAYPNVLSYINGWKMITKTTSPDKRTLLPILMQNGQQTTVQGMGNKITVLDMWYTGCGICYEKFPKLQMLSDHYLSDTNVYIATLNLPLENEITTGVAFDAVKQYHFNKLKSPASIDSNLWGINQFPTLLIFDKQHRLRYSGNLEVDNAAVINNTYDIIERLKAE